MLDAGDDDDDYGVDDAYDDDDNVVDYDMYDDGAYGYVDGDDDDDGVARGIHAMIYVNYKRRRVW